MSLVDLLPEEDIPGYQRYRAELLSGDSPGRKQTSGRNKLKDGRIIEIEVTGNDVLFNGRNCRVAYCLDVTERNAAAASSSSRASSSPSASGATAPCSSAARWRWRPPISTLSAT